VILIYGGKNVDEEGDSRRRWVSFLTFLRLFIRYCFILRGLLVAQAALVILLGAVFASAASAIWIVSAIIVAGVYRILQALRGGGRGGSRSILYVAGGAILLLNPLRASLSLTLMLGIIWILSGLVRVFLAEGMGRGRRAFMLSGTVSIIAGLVILFQWPASGLWVLGLCLGVDPIFHGIVWTASSLLVLADQPRRFA